MQRFPSNQYLSTVIGKLDDYETILLLSSGDGENTEGQSLLQDTYILQLLKSCDCTPYVLNSTVWCRVLNSVYSSSDHQVQNQVFDQIKGYILGANAKPVSVIPSKVSVDDLKCVLNSLPEKISQQRYEDGVEMELQQEQNLLIQNATDDGDREALQLVFQEEAEQRAAERNQYLISLQKSEQQYQSEIKAWQQTQLKDTWTPQAQPDVSSTIDKQSNTTPLVDSPTPPSTQQNVVKDKVNTISDAPVVPTTATAQSTIAYSKETLQPEPVVETTATLKMKLPDDSYLMCTLQADDTLQSVKQYIDINRQDCSAGAPYQIVQQYPNRVFEGADYAQTLHDLQLTGRQMLVVKPLQRSQGARSLAVSSANLNLSSLVQQLLGTLRWLVAQLSLLLGLNLLGPGDTSSSQQSQGTVQSGGGAKRATWGANIRSLHSEEGGAGNMGGMGSDGLDQGQSGDGNDAKDKKKDSKGRNQYWNGNSVVYGDDNNKGDQGKW